MITGCKEAGLPEPEFAQSGGEFVVTLWRDWLTDEVLADLEINDRQKQAIRFVKEKSRINNSEYRELVKISMRNASRDLTELVEKEIFEKKGIHGKGVHYVLGKRARKGPEEP
jgi:predicted HTH transcriptional regulator